MTAVEDATRGKDADRPALDVACLNPTCRRAALVSTTGNHCEVWRSTRKHEALIDGQPYTEFVIKHPVERYSDADTRILASQYQMLRKELGDIVPEALFVRSCINEQPNLFIIARAVNIWFNIANPQNREEAIGLLCDFPLARAQLAQFVRKAEKWRQGPNPRVIDLYGLDNLVMDNLRQIRFIDSFYVFFFEDMLHLLGGEPDYELQDKIDLSLHRLAYLKEILALSESKCGGQSN